MVMNDGSINQTRTSSTCEETCEATCEETCEATCEERRNVSKVSYGAHFRRAVVFLTLDKCVLESLLQTEVSSSGPSDNLLMDLVKQCQRGQKRSAEGGARAKYLCPFHGQTVQPGYVVLRYEVRGMKKRTAVSRVSTRVQ
jgi:hypothetical protein